MQPVSDPLITKLPGKTNFFRKTFDFNLGSLNLKPEYWEAITILFLVFLIVFTIARWRHLYVKWNLSSFIPSVMLGFMLALILEGFLLLGGRTLFTEVLGWNDAPKPISTVIDMGRSKMVQVLGASENAQIPTAVADEAPTLQSVVSDYEFLEQSDKNQIKSYICSPDNN